MSVTPEISLEIIRGYAGSRLYYRDVLIESFVRDLNVLILISKASLQIDLDPA
jgi:hypothetical protein